MPEPLASRFGLAMAVALVLAGCGPPRSDSRTSADPAGGARAGGEKAARVRLRGPAEFFVSPSGRDDAGGRTAAAPWRTLQHAYDVVSQDYDLAGFPVTIRLADGTYGPRAGKDNVVFCDGRIVGQVGPVRFVGNPAHPERVILSVRSNNIFEIIATSAHVDGMTLTGTGSTVGLLSYFNARVTFTNLVFGPMGEGIHLSAFGGIIMAQSDYRITGGAGYHLLAQTPGSRIDIDRRTVTLANAPRFSAAFAVAQNLAMISAYGNRFVGTGAAGTRFIVRNNGVLQTGGGLTYLPGDAAGTVTAGGRYGP